MTYQGIMGSIWETDGDISATCWLFFVPLAQEKEEELVPGAPEAEQVQFSDIYSK